MRILLLYFWRSKLFGNLNSHNFFLNYFKSESYLGVQKAIGKWAILVNYFFLKIDTKSSFVEPYFWYLFPFYYFCQIFRTIEWISSNFPCFCLEIIILGNFKKFSKHIFKSLDRFTTAELIWGSWYKIRFLYQVFLFNKLDST